MDIYTGYRPHKIQVPFHKSNAKFRAMITGVGAGKSCAGANEIIRLACQYPESTHLICAPNSKIMLHATLNQFWQFCPPEILLIHKKFENTIYLTNGAKIIYLTADNERHIERLRGIEIGDFWADEASLFVYLFWKILMGRLRDKYGPLKGFLTTTPRGKNWIYSCFVKKEDPETRQPFLNPDDYEWFSGSTLDNPHLPEEYKKNLLNQYSGKFKDQEIYGQFTSFFGQVFSNFDIGIHIIKTEPKKMVEYVFGVDFGFTNAMASGIFGFDNDGRMYLLDEYYKTQQHVEDLSNWLDEMKKKYGKLTIGYGDPSSPDNLTRLRKLGHNIREANNAVLPGIQEMYKRFEVQGDGKPRLFIHERCIHFIDEVTQYRYADKKEEKETKEEPMKIDDHMMDMSRYVIFSHKFGSKDFSILSDPDNVLGFN